MTTIMMTFLIMTNVSKTEVSRVWAQVRANPMHNGVSDRWIFKGAEFVAHNNVNDDEYINKCNGFPLGCTHGTATVPIPSRLMVN